MIKSIEDEAQEVAEAINRKHHADWNEFGMQQAYIAGANRDGWVKIIGWDESTLPDRRYLNRAILIYHSLYETQSVVFYKGYGIFEIHGIGYEATHWQTLPSAPLSKI